MYFFIRLIRGVLLRLPLNYCYFIGRIIGLLFYLNGRKRRVAFGNIKSAFPHKNYKDVQIILKRSFINFGLNIIESLIAPRIYKNIEIRGEEKVTLEGGIFVGIHAGNWEVVVAAFAHKHKFAVLAKPQKHKGLDKFLNELRRAGKIKVCFTLRELIRCLRENYMIGMVLDHGAEDDAMTIDFFSHQVSTPKGAVYLAKKFNKKIYTNFSYRRDSYYHIAELEGPIDIGGKDDREILTYLNKIYQGYLEKYPWEYFWYYKRFKYKDNRDIVILSDSKPGHLKQSKAFFSLLSEEKYKARSKIIEIKYKNRLCRFMAEAAVFFSGKNCLGRGRYLSFFVDKNTWAQLDSVYADIVISAGSSAAAANKLFSSYLGAKSVVILKPNIPLSRFDLAVIPEHDRIEPSKKVAVFKGALYYPLNHQEKIKNSRDYFNLSGRKKVSFFIGGPLFGEEAFMEGLKLFIPKLKAFSSKQGYKILISTSRRTPIQAESYLEQELGDFVHTEALVIASRKNYDFVFEGFSLLADIIFVSSESVSMVSEAASLGKPCICVFFEKEDSKHKAFIESIKDEITLLRKPYDIKIEGLKTSRIFNSNKEALEGAIRKIL
ncbi:MAG: ELM1/GtrOC1 family putative glycosyltransferase [Candidatus Omnitrophota bacterium]